MAGHDDGDGIAPEGLAVEPDERFLNCRALYNSLKGLLKLK